MDKCVWQKRYEELKERFDSLIDGIGEMKDKIDSNSYKEKWDIGMDILILQIRDGNPQGCVEWAYSIPSGGLDGLEPYQLKEMTPPELREYAKKESSND